VFVDQPVVFGEIVGLDGQVTSIHWFPAHRRAEKIDKSLGLRLS
jgi:hypothetical protein